MVRTETVQQYMYLIVPTENSTVTSVTDFTSKNSTAISVTDGTYRKQCSNIYS